MTLTLSEAVVDVQTVRVSYTADPTGVMGAVPIQDAVGNDAADDFVEAGRALSDCDLVVMHCMGYTEAQRATVARASGRPVLLARRLVAAALSQLL